MTHAAGTEAEFDAALAEAIEWIVLFSSRDVTEEEANAFHRWRIERPANAQVYSEIARHRPILRDASVQHAQKARVGRRAVLAGGGTALAAIGAFGLVRPPYGLWPSLSELMADHRTGIGERYAFAPSAGVMIEMNSRTSVGVFDRGNGIDLIDGEAFVTVKRVAGFRIEALGTSITASNASFNVETLDGAFRVGCVSGHLRCAWAGRNELLNAGEQLSLIGGSAVRRRLERTAMASWREGVLVFEGAPLREVIARLNRYRSGAIVLTNGDKAERPVSAVFFTSQIDSALGQLQTLMNLTGKTLPGGVVLLS